ncbi:MAG TPA: hypothetical protein VK861_04935, partial [Bacteroidales bacterium]|nr:hypothetical protein [Bacteroidales bacterium]
MKNQGILMIFTLFLLLSFLNGSLNAQIVDPAKKVEKEGERRVNRGIDRTINKGFDKVEQGIGNLFKKKTSGGDEKGEGVDDPEDDGAEKGVSETSQSAPSLSWAKYDFMPGDQVIFEDNLTGEENGEFPSRWDLYDGNIEVA